MRDGRVSFHPISAYSAEFEKLLADEAAAAGGGALLLMVVVVRSCSLLLPLCLLTPHLSPTFSLQIL